MDEPVRRRSFVRLAATGAVQNAGRLAALSGIAAGMVAQGVASLADATSDQPDASDAPPPPTPTVMSPPGSAPAAPARSPTLDAATIATLITSTHLLLVVNRPQAGPFLNRYPFQLRDGVVRIESRASSAMAQHVRSDGHVTLLLDEPGSGQRLMVFGTARLVEGADASDEAAGSTTASPTDHERAVIVVQPSHAIRMPL